MEKLFMSAGVVVTIVMCIVGCFKLPFKKFKNSHPVAFKAIFTLLSVFVASGLCVLDELYILKGELWSWDFVILVFVVLAGVFGGYSGIYEGLGLKELMKKLSENIKKAKAMSNDKKVEKYLSKIENIDKAIVFLEERKNIKNSEV